MCSSVINTNENSGVIAHNKDSVINREQLFGTIVLLHMGQCGKEKLT